VAALSVAVLVGAVLLFAVLLEEGRRSNAGAATLTCATARVGALTHGRTHGRTGTRAAGWDQSIRVWLLQGKKGALPTASTRHAAKGACACVLVWEGSARRVRLWCI
jgi:hypothetical protein